MKCENIEEFKSEVVCRLRTIANCIQNDQFDYFDDIITYTNSDANINYIRFDDISIKNLPEIIFADIGDVISFLRDQLEDNV